MVKGNLSQSISDFSKQLSRFTEAQKTQREEPLTNDKKLQQRINDLETDRRERILQQYNVFNNPLSKQIEEDEGALVDAYKLFKSLLELNSEYQKSGTKLASLKIASPLCSRSEYVTGFSFLRIWFLKHQANVEYVPVMVDEDKNRYLDFVPLEEYQYSRLEKEILQVIEEIKN